MPELSTRIEEICDDDAFTDSQRDELCTLLSQKTQVLSSEAPKSERKEGHIDDLYYTFDPAHSLGHLYFGESTAKAMKRIAHSRCMQILFALNVFAYMVLCGAKTWNTVGYACYLLVSITLVWILLKC